MRSHTITTAVSFRRHQVVALLLVCPLLHVVQAWATTTTTATQHSRHYCERTTSSFSPSATHLNSRPHSHEARLLEEGILVHTTLSRRQYLIAAATCTAVSLHTDATFATATTDTAVRRFLRPIPTFTLTDSSGVPFMVVGDDAIVTGYFFVTYAEAARILSVAGRKGPWKGAVITTVPAEAAVTLAYKSARSSQFMVAAAESDRDEAMQITGQDELAEQKVPLFYYEDFVLSRKEALGDDDDDDDDDETMVTPLYFSVNQLRQAFARHQPKAADAPPPPVKVTELFATLSALVKDETLNLALVPPKDSAKRARECAKRGPSFVLGKSNVVL